MAKNSRWPFRSHYHLSFSRLFSFSLSFHLVSFTVSSLLLLQNPKNTHFLRISCNLYTCTPIYPHNAVAAFTSILYALICFSLSLFHMNIFISNLFLWHSVFFYSFTACHAIRHNSHNTRLL